MAGTSCSRRRRPVWPGNCASADSSLSALIWSNCSRRAAASNAARWNCVRKREVCEMAGTTALVSEQAELLRIGMDSLHRGEPQPAAGLEDEVDYQRATLPLLASAR